MKKNVIMICIDGGRVDFAKHSSILQDYLPGTIFFSNSITYAPYTNSSVHAVISGCYGNRNGCDSYWNSANFDLKNFLNNELDSLFYIQRFSNLVVRKPCTYRFEFYQILSD